MGSLTEITSSQTASREIDINSWRATLGSSIPTVLHRQAGGTLRLPGPRSQCHPPYAPELRQGAGQRQSHHLPPVWQKNIQCLGHQDPGAGRGCRRHAASIRNRQPQESTKEGLCGQSGTATEEMLDFLSACLRYGVSICVAGRHQLRQEFTVAGWLLSTIPGPQADLHHRGRLP